MRPPRKRRPLLLAFAAISAVALAAVAVAPRALVDRPGAVTIDADVDEWLARREAETHQRTPIIPGAEKRLLWHDPAVRARTKIAVVYLHGFSATRQEMAPVAELVAGALDANLFETRLTGHGHSLAALDRVRAEDWLDDAAEALAVGEIIGERVVVIGTSTGATLALAMAGHESFAVVSDLVLVSPNFAPRDSNAEILTWPGGPQLATLLVGETRSWTAANPLQEKYWSTTYPMAAAVEMMRLVKLARSKLPMRMSQNLLTLYSPNDEVIDTERMLSSLERIESPRQATFALERSGDPSNHVLAGDILAPENNAAVVERIVAFINDGGL